MKNIVIKNIRLRLTLYYSLLIIGVSLLLVYAISRTFMVEFQERKNELKLQQMDVINESIDNKMKGYFDNTKELKHAALVEGYMNGTIAQPNVQKYIQESIYYIKGIKSFVLINSKDEIVSSFAAGDSEIQGKKISSIISEAKDNYYSIPHNYPFGDFQEDYMNNQTVTYCAAVRDNESYERKGFILSNITRDYLCSGALEYGKEFFDQIYIMNISGDFIYRTGERVQMVEKQIQDALHNVTYQGGYYTNQDTSFFVKQLQVNPEWLVVGVISNDNLMWEINRIRMFILGICCVGVLLVVMISHLIAKRITQPIFALKDAMAELVDGEVPPKVDIVAYDELEYLVQGYNSMVEDLNVYMNAMYQYGREVLEAEILSLKFQLESLQSQINPHFLYNTLNTVSYLAMQQRTDDVRKLIQSLNQLLRCTLSDISEFLTIEEEIGFLQAYVKIQEYRYPDMAALHIVCDTSVKEMMIPKLILQPLVENALLHGIFPTGEKGNIYVRMVQKDNRILVAVEDDGIGMKTEEIEKIRENGRKGFNRIGVENVRKRLCLYYGVASDLIISSEYGQGTVITFEIPAERERVDG